MMLKSSKCTWLLIDNWWKRSCYPHCVSSRIYRFFTPRILTRACYTHNSETTADGTRVTTLSQILLNGNNVCMVTPPRDPEYTHSLILRACHMMSLSHTKGLLAQMHVPHCKRIYKTILYRWFLEDLRRLLGRKKTPQRLQLTRAGAPPLYLPVRARTALMPLVLINGLTFPFYCNSPA